MVGKIVSFDVLSWSQLNYRTYSWDDLGEITLCGTCVQLLARPVSEDEFRQMAYLKDSFFELGMTSVSHPKCLVESDKNGTVVFEFGLDPSKQCSFTTELYKSAHDPALNTVQGFSFDQFSTLENLQDKLRVTISFPRIGRYKFELDGKEVTKQSYSMQINQHLQCFR